MYIYIFFHEHYIVQWPLKKKKQRSSGCQPGGLKTSREAPKCLTIISNDQNDLNIVILTILFKMPKRDKRKIMYNITDIIIIIESIKIINRSTRDVYQLTNIVLHIGDREI